MCVDAGKARQGPLHDTHKWHRGKCQNIIRFIKSNGDLPHKESAYSLRD